MTRKEKLIDILEIAFKLMFLSIGFLQYSSLTFGSPIISWVQWPMLALGGVLLLCRVKDWRLYACTKGFWLLMLFTVSYAVSAAVNLKYGWYDNLRFLIFLGLQITLLFTYSKNTPAAASRRHTEICAWFYIGATALLSLLSFMFMIFGISAIYEQEFGPTYNIGFWWGRLFGAYWDPNIGAVMAVVCCLLCAALIVKYKSRVLRICLIANIVLQILYVEFSDSRTGKICLVIATAVLGFMYTLRFFREKKTALRCALSAVVAIIVAVSVLAFANLSGGVYNYVVTETADSSTGDSQLEPIGREEDIAQDISNRRFDIWSSAVELFRSSPVVGVSHGNIVAYAQENLPDTYIINNDHMVFNTMHNVAVDILASQGIIGVVLFVAAALMIAFSIIIKLPTLFSSEHFYFYAALFATVVTAVVSAMFMTELVYVVSPLTLMFWIAVGGLSHATKCDGILTEVD